MGELNVKNRTLAIMDNLQFLRSLNNECIDLIAIDPPFAANETFIKKPKPDLTKAEIREEKKLARKHKVQHNEGIGETRVDDYWHWDDIEHPGWKAMIEDTYPEIHSVIEAVEAVASESEAAYICFMAIRLLECRRVLKNTGTIYVHCDWHANAYLRMLMDAIFGIGHKGKTVIPGFRNEIIWGYPASPSPVKTDFPRKHDTILRYSKSTTWTFNADAVRVPYADSSMERIQYPANASTVMRGTEIQLQEGGKIPPPHCLDRHTTGISVQERVHSLLYSKTACALQENDCGVFQPRRCCSRHLRRMRDNRSCCRELSRRGKKTVGRLRYGIPLMDNAQKTVSDSWYQIRGNHRGNQ